MAKETFIAAIIAAVTGIFVVSFSSCTKESQFLGMDEKISSTKSQPVEKTEINFEVSSFAFAADTAECSLQGYAEMEVEKTLRKNEEITEGIVLHKSLSSNVYFNAQPVKVDVAEEALLNKVELSAVSRVDVAPKATADSAMTYGATFSFSFNAGERVLAMALWQNFKVEGNEFSAAGVDTIAFTGAQIAHMYAVSETVKVAEINLYFNVEMSVNGKPCSYAVRVPVSRVYTAEPTTPAEYSERIENVSYNGEFSVVAQSLQTDYQEVSCDRVTLLGNEKVADEKTQLPLNLRAAFNVSSSEQAFENEESLMNVSLVGTEYGDDKINISENGKFATTSRSREEYFTLNGGEKVAVASLYEYASYDGDVLPYSDIQSISFVKGEVAEDVAKSSDERKVAKVTLRFNVDVVLNSPAATRSGSEEITTYEVVLSYERSMQVAKPEEPKVPITEIFPENRGKLLGAAASVVPADQESGKYAQLCFTVRFEKGASAVTCPLDQIVPTKEQFAEAYFAKSKQFNEKYNSGFFTNEANRGTYKVGVWAPAIAKDLSDRVAYYKDNTSVRFVTFKDLSNGWNWRNGNFSTKVEGYEFSVSEDGVLSIAYNGEVVMRVK